MMMIMSQNFYYRKKCFNNFCAAMFLTQTIFFSEHSFGDMLIHVGSTRGAHINHDDQTTRQTRGIARVSVFDKFCGF